MFPTRFFPDRYFCARYWDKAETTPDPEPPPTPPPVAAVVGGAPSHRPLFTGKWIRRDLQPKLSRRERRRLKQNETIARDSQRNEGEQRLQLPQSPSVYRAIESQSRIQEIQKVQREKAVQAKIKAKERGLTLMRLEAKKAAKLKVEKRNNRTLEEKYHEELLTTDPRLSTPLPQPRMNLGIGEIETIQMVNSFMAERMRARLEEEDALIMLMIDDL